MQPPVGRRSELLSIIRQKIPAGSDQDAISAYLQIMGRTFGECRIQGQDFSAILTAVYEHAQLTNDPLIIKYVFKTFSDHFHNSLAAKETLKPDYNDEIRITLAEAAEWAGTDLLDKQNYDDADLMLRRGLTQWNNLYQYRCGLASETDQSSLPGALSAKVAIIRVGTRYLQLREHDAQRKGREQWSQEKSEQVKKNRKNVLNLVTGEITKGDVEQLFMRIHNELPFRMIVDYVETICGYCDARTQQRSCPEKTRNALEDAVRRLTSFVSAVTSDLSVFAKRGNLIASERLYDYWMNRAAGTNSSEDGRIEYLRWAFSAAQTRANLQSTFPDEVFLDPSMSTLVYCSMDTAANVALEIEQLLSKKIMILQDTDQYDESQQMMWERLNWLCTEHQHFLMSVERNAQPQYQFIQAKRIYRAAQAAEEWAYLRRSLVGGETEYLEEIAKMIDTARSQYKVAISILESLGDRKRLYTKCRGGIDRLQTFRNGNRGITPLS